jgi:hypothetical protein
VLADEQSGNAEG